jgi:hypothetical protein
MFTGQEHCIKLAITQYTGQPLSMTGFNPEAYEGYGARISLLSK